MLSASAAVVALIATTAALGSNPSAPPSPLASFPGGLVTAQGAGAVRFGASEAQVRRWTGNPVFTIRGSDRDKNAVIWGWQCPGAGRNVCETRFGFVGGRFTAFCTESPVFRTAHGVRPGIAVANATRLEPRVPLLNDVPKAWKGLRVPRLALIPSHAFSTPDRIWALYASSGQNRAFNPNCA